MTLASFQAEAQAGHIAVTWETASELDNQSFNLYRAESASAPRALLASIPSQAPGSTQGFAYTYDDLAVQPGQTYWYWLEDVSLSGATTLHGPVSATVQRADGGDAGFAAGHAGCAGDPGSHGRARRPGRPDGCGGSCG